MKIVCITPPTLVKRCLRLNKRNKKKPVECDGQSV